GEDRLLVLQDRPLVGLDRELVLQDPPLVLEDRLLVLEVRLGHRLLLWVGHAAAARGGETVARGREGIKAGGMGNATAPRALPSLSPTRPGRPAPGTARAAGGCAARRGFPRPCGRRANRRSAARSSGAPRRP